MKHESLLGKSQFSNFEQLGKSIHSYYILSGEKSSKSNSSLPAIIPMLKSQVIGSDNTSHVSLYKTVSMVSVFRWLYWWKSCCNNQGESVNFILKAVRWKIPSLCLMFKLLIFHDSFGCWMCQPFLVIFFCRSARSGTKTDKKDSKLPFGGFWIMQNSCAYLCYYCKS